MLKIHHKPKIFIPVLVAIIALAGGGGYWYTTQQKDSSQEKPSAQSTSSNKKDENNSGGGISASKEKSGDQNSSSQTNPPAPSAVTPGKPVGVFVSNHRPNLSGHPAPNSENSTCSTTPGMQCQIKFTMNGITKYLPAHTTSQDGNTSWNWTLQDIGLTRGTWDITAIAINGNKTATSQDATKLMISP